MRPINSARLIFAVAAILLLNSCGARKDASSKVFDLGSRIETGHLVYTVFETQWQSQIGTGDAARVPKNRFFLIRISAVNSGSEELMVPNATLIDDDNKSIDELTDGEQIPQWLGYVRKVKPADSIAGNIAFDVEPKHYRLRLTDEDGEKPALVDLPLNFNSETPQVPVPTSGSDFSAPVKK